MSLSKLDQNQILRTVFSPADGALKTVPAAATSFSIELDSADGDNVAVNSHFSDTVVALNAVAAQTSVQSASIDVSAYKNIAVMISHAGLTGTLDGVVKLQASLDDVIYDDLSSASYTLASASGQRLLLKGDAAYKYLKIDYAHGNISGGTVTVKYCLKG